MTDANCMQKNYDHEAHAWSLSQGGGTIYQCNGAAASRVLDETGEQTRERLRRVQEEAQAANRPPAAAYEIPYERQLQAQALHTIFSALGGLQVYGGFDGTPGITMDDTSSVRSTRRYAEPGGKRWLYTTNVTVSVSRVELT